MNGVVCSREWSGWDENKHLQVRSHDSQLEKEGCSIWRAAEEGKVVVTISGGDQVPRGHVHEEG